MLFRSLFEAPHRLVALLEDVLDIWGDRPLHLARELTKRHEEHLGPSVVAVLEHFKRVPPQGECTLVLAGAPEAPADTWDDTSLRRELGELIHTGLTRSEACRQLAERSGWSRRALYALLHQQELPAEGPTHEQRVRPGHQLHADSPTEQNPEQGPTIHHPVEGCVDQSD